MSSLDNYTKQQITPLFSNSDLRKNGVTLHLQIQDRREPIKGVPAVYYVEPTEDNIRRIVKDCSSPIYEINYIHFSSSISRYHLGFHFNSREMMTLFAQLCVENNCAQRISRVSTNLILNIGVRLLCGWYCIGTFSLHTTEASHLFVD